MGRRAGANAVAVAGLMKNLLILHLESITWQRLSAFASAFPNLRRLIGEARSYDNFFSSATSTLMVVTYLFHGNDFEFDSSSEFEGMRPEANNPHLFSTLCRRGYHANLVCLNAFHGASPTKLAAWSDDLPPAWGTNDFPTLFARFDALTDELPFAIYVWDLITHIEHSLAVAPYASGLTDQVRRACGVADHAIGELLGMLERKGLLENTTIVVYGDHGDDYWTHGYKGGMVHATEPYTQITWTPLAIRIRTLPAESTTGSHRRSTSLRRASRFSGFPTKRPFLTRESIFAPAVMPQLFSQNFTANQPDNRQLGIAKALRDRRRL